MDQPPLEVRGVQVHLSGDHKRTVRLDVLIKGGDTVSLAIDLPIVTRLTDQLIDAEYLERRPAHVEMDDIRASEADGIGRPEDQKFPL